MTGIDLYGEYAEALGALRTLEGRQRAALRQAVESASAVQEQARSTLAAQQRMYDHARREIDEAGRLLEEVRNALGAAPVAIGPAAQVGVPPSLIEIRASVGVIARWAGEAKPVAESLLRSRARLARGGPPAPTISTPIVEPSRRGRGGVVAAVVSLVAVAVVLTIVILAF